MLKFKSKFTSYINKLFDSLASYGLILIGLAVILGVVVVILSGILLPALAALSFLKYLFF